MKDLIIVGAGGYGRDVLSLVEHVNKTEPTWNILGFISDDLHALDHVKCNYSILGTIDSWIPKPNEHFVLGIGRPQAKQIVVEKMKKKNVVFETIMTKETVVNDFAKIGEGCLFWGTNIGDNAKIGDFVHALGAPAIGQEVEIGDYCTLGFSCNIASGKIGKRVFVGSNAVVLGNRKVGDDAIIGAASVIISNVKSGVTMMGNPAKAVNL